MIHISFVRIRFTAHSFRALRGRPTPGREVFISHMKATNSCSSPQHHSPSSCLQPQQADARRTEGCCSWRLATQGGVCVSRFVLSGGRDHRESVWPCARAPRVTSPRPARARRGAPAPASRRGAPGSPAVLCRFRVWGPRPPPWGRSHPRAVLCSFSPSSHCSRPCCAPRPRTGGLPPGPAGREPPQEGRSWRGTARARGPGLRRDSPGEPTLAAARALPTPPHPTPFSHHPGLQTSNSANRALC